MQQLVSYFVFVCYYLQLNNLLHQNKVNIVSEDTLKKRNYLGISITKF